MRNDMSTLVFINSVGPIHVTSQDHCHVPETVSKRKRGLLLPDDQLGVKSKLAKDTKVKCHLVSYSKMQMVNGIIPEGAQVSTIGYQ